MLTVLKDTMQFVPYAGQVNIKCCELEIWHSDPRERDAV